MEPKVTIREATEADATILAEIERNSPLVLGDRELTIDRGGDYFAAGRLMEDETVLLAHVNGVPAGVFCGARHRARLGGIDRWVVYIHHARILPEHQRHGLGRTSGGMLREKYAKLGYDTQYWYISSTNERSLLFASQAKNRWSFGPELLDIDSEAVGGGEAGRPATPEDARRVVEMINSAHAGEEMFLPYTAESLRDRLERAPKQYSWPNLLVGERAVVGVWPEGRWVTIQTRTPDGASASRGAAVLDYGCLPGGEDELVALLRTAARIAAGEGLETLSMFTSPGARLRETLLPLAGDVSHFYFWTPDIPEPHRASERGLYVDHIYF